MQSNRVFAARVMLFPCEETPSPLSVADAAQTLALLQGFILIEEIGRGATSLVVELSMPGLDGQKTNVAVKLMILSEDSIRDLAIACQLNAMRIYTPLFIHTFGWFLLAGLPEDWRDTFAEYPEAFNKETLLCQVMDKENRSLFESKAVFTEQEFKGLLFLLLHGIQMARQRLGFVHGDLTARQILLNERAPAELTLNTDTQVIVMANGRFMPKVIDFGLSSTLSHAEVEPDSWSSSESGSDDLFGHEHGTVTRIDSNDVTKVVTIIHERMQAQVGNRRAHKQQFTAASLRAFERQLLASPQYATAKAAPASDSQCIEQLLLGTGYFNDIILSRQPKRPIQQIERCMACGALATRQWKGTGLTFCGDGCSNYWAPIGCVVPVRERFTK